MSLSSLSNVCSGVSLSSVSSLSTLFTKSTGLAFSLSACLTTVSVCGIIPSTGSTTTTTPSTALMDLVTCPPKSTWPGVSMRLMM